ncbi:MAG: ATP-dependent Clp protease ATP-binding subunit [Deltaproteobacteria bacterium]|nr:ATP-dependent Clp protease ATP-binding subunit [Deltaproteobacteria bacterium]
MNLTVAVYQVRHRSSLVWTSVGLGPHTVTLQGYHPGKLQQQFLAGVRQKLAKLTPRELAQVQFLRGTSAEMVKLELALHGDGRRRKISLFCPIILEPRWASETVRFIVGYHPSRQERWFPVDPSAPLAPQATAFFQEDWAQLSDEELDALRAKAKGTLKALSLAVQPRSLLEELPNRPQGLWDDLRNDGPTRDDKKPKGGGRRVLPQLGVDLTALAIQGQFTGGAPRSPAREQLLLLLGGRPKRPVLLLGPSGSGRTTVLERWVHDLLDEDEYPQHRNIDRVHHVWRIAGKRIIAGMSYLGDWEKRCLDLLEDAREARAILAVEDLHLWGRIGQSRDSERNLAEFFAPALARGEVVLVGECTPEQLRQLEEEAPSFAGLFTRVSVPATDAAETFRMMVQEVRALEPLHHVVVDPLALRAILELGGSLFPTRAFPGKALDLLRSLCRANASEDKSGRPNTVNVSQVLELLEERTGISRSFLEAAESYSLEEVADELRSRVLGQAEAVTAAAGLILRIRTGLTDPRRPFGVFLFTGPTGTGKTELARALAEYLYGASERLVRFDMGEYSGPDAAARLLGDRWTPEGALTRAAREQPFSVVLLDEIEKAHPLVHNLLLQVFDEGRLTDAAGNTASFTHCVLVMTSNLGARPRGPSGFGDHDVADAHDHLRAVREFFAPELFNRIDRVVAFRALDPEVAREVARKELARLLQRRGLVDRNVFATAAPAVLDRIVAEAFRAADGARSLKRYLEDVVGSALTEHLAGPSPGELQLVRLVTRERGLGLEVRALQEAQPEPGVYALDRLQSLGREALLGELTTALGTLDALARSPSLEGLSEALQAHLEGHQRGETGHADTIFTLDTVRAHLSSLRERLEELSRAADQRDAWELYDLEVLGQGLQTTVPGWRGDLYSWRVFDRRSVGSTRSAPDREELLGALAEVNALRRVLSCAADPDQHAVLLELSYPGLGTDADETQRVPLGPRGKNLLSLMLQAYARARGALEELAFARPGDGPDGWLVSTIKLKPRGHPGAMPRVLARVVGIGVRDFYAPEDGIHVWHSLSAPPVILQVRVLPSPRGASLEALLRDRLRSAREERTPPVVRVLRFEPPLSTSRPSPLELEDFVFGTSRQVMAREVTDALPGLWLHRLSREPEEPPQGGGSA